MNPPPSIISPPRSTAAACGYSSNIQKNFHRVIDRRKPWPPPTIKFVRGGRESAVRSCAATIDTAKKIQQPKPKSKKTLLAERWREIQGDNNWEGLLDPMDPILRGEIIRYGEFAQACYDAFDFDPFSKHCGSCKFHRREFFQSLEMPRCGYEITRYLCATSNINLPNFFKKSFHRDKLWSSHANWMGFVAVAQDEGDIKRLGRRDIVIAWRGTVTYLEWIADLMDFLQPAGFNSVDDRHPRPRHEVKVESGFLNLYTARENECRYCNSSARDQVVSEVKRVVEKYKGEQLSITITGHSLGSALGMLSAYDIAEMGLNRCGGERGSIPVTVFSFAGPRVGNSAFKERCEELGLKVLRVVNVHDGVPKVPGILFNEKWRVWKHWMEDLPWSYSHVGVELAVDVDHTHSPFLKATNDPSCFHNLEAYLHLLDGYHGRGKRFFPSGPRDPALVNKACDFLKEHHLVPPFWKQDASRGLVKNSEGRWVQPDHLHHDIDHDHREQTTSATA